MLSSVKKSVLDFLNKSFDVKYTKRSKIVAAIIGVLTLLFVIFSVGQFISQEFKSKWILLGFSLIFPFFVSTHITSGKIENLLSTRCHSRGFVVNR